MPRLKHKLTAVAMVGAMAALFVMPTDAEARRYRRVVRRAPVVVARPVVRPAVVRRAPVVVASPYVVRRAPVVVRAPYVGYGSVHVGGVYVGW